MGYKKRKFKIIKNNNFMFFKSKEGECYYSKSPCTHFFNGSDFKLDEINIKNFLGYKNILFYKLDLR